MSESLSMSESMTESLSMPESEHSKQKCTDDFWAQNPNVIFDRDRMFEFFPTEDMTYNQKLNAITRTILILTIITYGFIRNTRSIVIGAVTMFSIYVLHHYKMLEQKRRENFASPALDVLGDFDTTGIFDKPTPENPMSNVLLTDYDFNPKKLPAPPTASEATKDAILESAKQMVRNANPGHPDIDAKLFTDLGDRLSFEQSMRPFLSNPATTIPEDQSAFAEFCYGSMISCKEGNKFACARNLDRHTN